MSHTVQTERVVCSLANFFMFAAVSGTARSELTTT